MANDLQTGNETSLTELVTGIVNDVQDLTKQQLALFKQELVSDFRKSREVALEWLIGASVCLFGALLLFFALVYLLEAYTDIPLWGCFGIVAAVTSGAGAALLYAGKKKLDSFNPLPDESAEALKENLQCLTSTKKC